jgi:N-carbamoyl-L-amino-acid hydrolase
MGNMFARREGRDPRRAPVLFGSHLDSQPSGGKFDGALGVLAGLEVMRSLRDLDIATEAPLELVNWTDEEGSRFGRSLMGSGVWAGVYPEGEILAARDTEGVSVGEALDGIGARGPHPAAPFPADAYFELHIEQGPILEREESRRRRHRRAGAGLVGRARFGAGQPRRHHPALRPARRARVRGPRRGPWWTA